ncbi:MAG: hypothetical protein KTR15_08040 [Phycisphaeraceae bacterium]|nr:hypothetical protein [Phycisphaeraceae bacterium]
MIEIAVVLVLVSLLASTVAMSAGGMLNGATLGETVAQIDSLDSEARRTAKRLGHTIELYIDSETRRLTLHDPREPNAPPLGGITLPRTFELTQAWHLVRGEQQIETDLVIQYEPDGTATTWGVSISDPNTQEGLSSLAFLGMTGQMTQRENHEQARDILAEALGRHTD